MATHDIRINGKAAVTEAETLGELALELALPERGVALALDSKMIPREQWDETALKNGSEIIIVKAAVGG